MQTQWKWLFLIVTLLFSAQVAAKYRPLEPDWGVCTPTSTATINHSPWQHILHRYLYKGEGNVNLFHYDTVTRADRKLLDEYLAYLQSINIQHYNRNEQLAYWINLYNAKMVQIVIEHYPVSSVTNINLSKNPFEIGPFTVKNISVLGFQLSLYDINNRILHKYWHDPRIIFALNTAAMGSPNLRHHAYRGDNVQQMLEYDAYDFINTRGAKIQYRKLKISKLFIWFKKDFGNNDAGIIHFLQRYAEPKLYAQLKNIRYFSGTYFNWTLNG